MIFEKVMMDSLNFLYIKFIEFEKVISKRLITS